MKRFFSLSALVALTLLLPFAGGVYAQHSTLHSHDHSHAAHEHSHDHAVVNGVTFGGHGDHEDEKAQPFTVFRTTAAPRSFERPLPYSAVYFQVDPAEYAKLSAERGAAVYGQKFTYDNFALNSERSVTLDLERFDVLTEDAQVVAGTKNGDVVVEVDRGVYFKGSVRGEEGSYVYLAVFENHASGFIDMPEKNSTGMYRWYISPLTWEDKRQSTVIVFGEQDQELDMRNIPKCSAEEEESYEARVEQVFNEYNKTRKANKDQVQNAVLMVAYEALECDREYYGDHGNNLSRAATYALSLNGAKSAAYQRDLNCIINVPYLRVWTSTDPYPGTSTSTLLSQLRSYWNTNMGYVERTLVHLYSGLGGIGGRAYVNVLCNGSFGYAVSGLHNTYTFPLTANYVWDLYVAGHETGHNFGSSHTHNCSWNPAIDSCFDAEGGCFPNRVARQGTFMSYCHLTAFRAHSYWHPRSATLVRTRIEAASCIYPQSGSQPNDVRAANIVTPINGSPVVAGTAFTPQAIFQNVGTNNQANLTVTISIQNSGGTVVYTNSQNIAALNAGAQTQVSFASVALAAVDTYEASASIALAGDVNDDNNEIHRPFEVVSVAPGGTLSLTAPNGPASYTAGQVVNVTWTSSGVSEIRIEFTPDDGASWVDVISRTSAAAGSYAWTVNPIATTQGRIRISDRTNTALSDQSTNFLTVNVPNDIQALDILVPTPLGSTTSPAAPVISVRNNGSATQTNVDVQVRLVHREPLGEVFRHTYTIAQLEPGETQNFGIGHMSGRQTGNMMLFATAMHAGDLNPANDSVARTFDFSRIDDDASGGYYHSVAIQPSNGTVYTWGQGNYGQLGNGANLNSNTPVKVKNLFDAVDVAAGGWHCYALKDDGTIRSWGYGGNGRLGNGANLNQNTPVQVSGITDATAVASGVYHGLALRSNGTVMAWGYNGQGALGDGTNITSNVPVAVNTLTGVIAIAGGTWHSYALKSDGTVWAWGGGGGGQLGNGANANSNVPVQVSGISDAVAIASGTFHGLALLADGTVMAWGQGTNGQLGDNLGTNSNIPVAVNTLTEIKGISGGYNFSQAVKRDGSIYSWGLNNYGQLGIGNNIQQLQPVLVIGHEAQSLGENIGYHSLIIKHTGEICGSGYNIYGQLGDGTNTNSNVYVCGTPLNVSGVDKAVAGGYFHSMATKVADGTVWNWGRNNFGQLGDGTTTDSPDPVQMSGLTDVISIAGAYYNSHAVKADGTVWASGYNFYGQMGDGTNTNSSVPVQATGITDALAVAAKYYHTLVLNADGSVSSYGYNNNGQLGDGTTTDSNVPVSVSGLSGAVGIAAGYFHSVAVKSDGTVWSWGQNSFGQLGDGTTTNSPTPVQVSGITNAVAVAAGVYHSFALLADGTVQAWGYNLFGGLGDGSSTQRNSPVNVVGLTDVIEIAGAAYSSFAVKADGSLWGWGYNSTGLLGIGNTSTQLTPVQALGVGAVQDVGDSWFHSIIYKAGGTVCAAGYNSYYQVGDGTTTWRSLFVCQPDSYLRPPVAENNADNRLVDPFKAVFTPVTGERGLRAWPNPTNGEFTVEFTAPAQGNLTLSVSDALGREVYRLVHPAGSGMLRAAVDLSAQPQGVYLLRITDGSNTLASDKVVVR